MSPAHHSHEYTTPKVHEVARKYEILIDSLGKVDLRQAGGASNGIEGGPIALANTAVVELDTSLVSNPDQVRLAA